MIVEDFAKLPALLAEADKMDASGAPDSGPPAQAKQLSLF
jgi:hypothetical protein